MTMATCILNNCAKIEQYNMVELFTVLLIFKAYFA